MFAAVHAALVVLLARLADVDDVAIGTPVTGAARQESRQHPHVADPVVAGPDVRRPAHRRVPRRHRCIPARRDTVRAAGRVAGPERENAHSPLFQVMLEFLDGRTPHLDEAAWWCAASTPDRTSPPSICG
ncbi:hypothetical protein GS926_27510 [Rhodococcus hoagii]|nr:hypothetical protein [Prescottella equi]